MKKPLQESKISSSQELLSYSLPVRGLLNFSDMSWAELAAKLRDVLLKTDQALIEATGEDFLGVLKEFVKSAYYGGESQKGLKNSSPGSFTWPIAQAFKPKLEKFRENISSCYLTVYGGLLAAEPQYLERFRHYQEKYHAFVAQKGGLDALLKNSLLQEGMSATIDKLKSLYTLLQPLAELKQQLQEKRGDSALTIALSLPVCKEKDIEDLITEWKGKSIATWNTECELVEKRTDIYLEWVTKQLKSALDSLQKQSEFLRITRAYLAMLESYEALGMGKSPNQETRKQLTELISRQKSDFSRIRATWMPVDALGADGTILPGFAPMSVISSETREFKDSDGSINTQEFLECLGKIQHIEKMNINQLIELTGVLIRYGDPRKKTFFANKDKKLLQDIVNHHKDIFMTFLFIFSDVSPTEDMTTKPAKLVFLKEKFALEGRKAAQKEKKSDSMTEGARLVERSPQSAIEAAEKAWQECKVSAVESESDMAHLQKLAFYFIERLKEIKSKYEEPEIPRKADNFLDFCRWVLIVLTEGSEFYSRVVGKSSRGNRPVSDSDFFIRLAQPDYTLKAILEDMGIISGRGQDKQKVVIQNVRALYDVETSQHPIAELCCHIGTQYKKYRDNLLALLEVIVNDSQYGSSDPKILANDYKKIEKLFKDAFTQLWALNSVMSFWAVEFGGSVKPVIKTEDSSEDKRQEKFRVQFWLKALKLLGEQFTSFSVSFAKEAGSIKDSNLKAQYETLHDHWLELDPIKRVQAGSLSTDTLQPRYQESFSDSRRSTKSRLLVDDRDKSPLIAFRQSSSSVSIHTPSVRDHGRRDQLLDSVPLIPNPIFSQSVYRIPYFRVLPFQSPPPPLEVAYTDQSFSSDRVRFVEEEEIVSGVPLPSYPPLSSFPTNPARRSSSTTTESKKPNLTSTTTTTATTTTTTTTTSMPPEIDLIDVSQWRKFSDDDGSGNHDVEAYQFLNEPLSLDAPLDSPPPSLSGVSQNPFSLMPPSQSQVSHSASSSSSSSLSSASSSSMPGSSSDSSSSTDFTI